MNYPDSNDLYQGKFDDGDPLTGRIASQDSADHMNAVYDELINLIREGDVVENVNALSQLALSVKNQIRGTAVMTTSGEANALVLATPAGKQPIQALKDYDKVYFRVKGSNTESKVTLTIDGLAAIPLSNVVGANQLLQGALATVTYLDGTFWLTQQINPKTGNDVNDIGKLIVDTTNHVASGEVVLDGSTLSRTEHPIFWAKVQTISNLIDQAKKDADPQQYAGYYGTGDGSTTFTLPTLGGEFIRGYDNGRGVDENRGFASFQGDAGRKITGQWGQFTSGISRIEPGSSNGVFYSTGKVAYQGSVVVAGKLVYPTHIAFDSSRVVPTANENRPRNIAYFFKTRV